ncbi:hypothetical protein [Streptomyces sp. bgisy084]|uniref:hypothetical protein n=1 Tax=Streptomyces sp. bgisy084 TaxID=3413777 RepID=UPI003D717BF4
MALNEDNRHGHPARRADSSGERTETTMTSGISWDSLPTVFEAPGTEIRRQDHGGMAVCRIRLEAGVRTDPVFAGLPDDRCPYPHWGHIISGSMRVHGPDGVHEFASGESYYWAPGHNLEALTELEYLEVTPAKDYDALMSHVRCAAAQGVSAPS